MMRIGLDLAVNDPPELFGRVVRAVECGGFQALWFVDNGLWGRDLFVHLGWAAVLTRHVRLGPGVTHPMIRHPGVIANSLASVDPGERVATLFEEIPDLADAGVPRPGGATAGQ